MKQSSLPHFSNSSVSQACFALHVPEAADFLLGPPEDGLIRGMSLPPDVLTKIYCDNWSRLVGSEPQALNVERAIEACERLAATAEALSGRPSAETEAALVAKSLGHVTQSA